MTTTTKKDADATSSEAPKQESVGGLGSDADVTPQDGQAYNEAVLARQKIADLERQLTEAQKELQGADLTVLTSEAGTKVQVPTDQVDGLKSAGFGK